MIDYNLVLYIGIALIVGGFCLFLYSEMKLAQLDREQFKNNQLLESFRKAKEMEKTWRLAKKIVSRRYKK
mgnify:CR=1 FL=1